VFCSRYELNLFVTWINFSRLEDNIEMDLKNVGWEGVDWIDLALHRTSGDLFWTR
jgi:hypothetical protein